MLTCSLFGRTLLGDAVHEYVLTTRRARVSILDFGATIRFVEVPDARGNRSDVLLGFDSLEGYMDDPACYGATIGPVANRTDRAEVPLAGQVYHLEGNDPANPQNNLHTSLDHGLHKRMWKRCEEGANPGQDALVLSYRLLDGELGLPGNRAFVARFRLHDVSPDATELQVSYTCTTDAPTYVNLTNHSYYNLAGHDSGSCLNQVVSVNASSYLPLREDNISQAAAPVEGTPFDFRQPHALGERIRQSNEQLRRGNGYDHCLCVDGCEPNGNPRPALHAEDPQSGRTLDVLITTPGAHLYTGNWLDDANAKAGAHYHANGGFAFEPEFYPDCYHHADWPQPVCTPEHPYQQTIVYRLGCK